MGSIEKVEDIESWKKTRKLVGEISRVTSDGRFSKDFGLRDQIRRAAISIMLNIAEGFGRRTDKEFAQFLFVALGSVAEVQSALYIALDQKYVDEPAFQDVYNQSSEVARMVSGFIKYLRKT
jgi:four helix bundle protein